ncbi:MAG TPA: DNA methyltransferase, partial [Caldilineaceae bacterium]|nr:DNA methyltransferase [Caldilineaceae bacterium]
MTPTQPELLREEAATYSTDGPVTCLGMTFPDEAARRAYFSERLREHLQDPEFRAIEGFPVGDDEAILALSDPPYYTACPNPFLPEIIADWTVRRTVSPTSRANSPTYKREPFAADVSEGKNDPIYNAHSYHTKVPHKAIMRYILHYTEPGDIVFDGFCGTGMTGVAAQLCGDRAVVESLFPVRRTVSPTETSRTNSPTYRIGARRAILNDLSPAATFIAYNYNTPVDAGAFEREAKRILREVERELGWMYETLHTDGKTKARINYTVWSEVFACPTCNAELVLWNIAVDPKTRKVAKNFYCSECGTELTKNELERVQESYFYAPLGKMLTRAKQVPVLINYGIGKSRFEKQPDDFDIEIVGQIENVALGNWIPSRRIDEDIDLWYERDYRTLGIYSIDMFYTRRNLLMLSWLQNRVRQEADERLRNQLICWLQSVTMGFSKLN